MTMPPRLTVLGDLERHDHYHLPPDAKCYFWGEYTPYEHTNGLKWDFSPTNRLITNFKKKMDRAGRPDWRYKQEAIQQIALKFSQFWKWNEFHQSHRVMLVPMPPSRQRTDPMYDSRMLDVLNLMARNVGLELDIRDCLSFSGAFGASHESDDRPTPDDLYADLSFINPAGCSTGQPGVIFLFDDMLTTGAHFTAANRRLASVFPGVQVVANFIARRRLPNPFQDEA
jgi:hypothetical protein